MTIIIIIYYCQLAVRQGHIQEYQPYCLSTTMTWQYGEEQLGNTISVYPMYQVIMMVILKSI